MRFVHSFNTRPLGIEMYNTALNDRIVGTIWYYALSLAYLKQLKQEVVLYTDTYGKTLLGHLPYDEIHTTLDDMPTDLSPRFWAAGKIYAMEQEPLGSIHIDGDVFIKKQELIDDIEQNEWDVIVQNYEYFYYYHFGATCLMWKDNECCFENGLILNRPGSYNTGVMGFREKNVKDKFINGYKTITLHFSEQYIEELQEDQWLTLDLVTEQKYIHDCCKSLDSKVKFVLPYPLEQWGEATQHAKEIGYQHVFTSSKYNCIDVCQKILEQVSPKLYLKNKELCQKVLTK